VRASIARSQQAFTATPGKNHGHLGTNHDHQIPLSLLYSCSTQILPFFLLRLWLLLLVSLAFQLLLGSLLMPTFPAIACFPAVAACLTATFTATNFPWTSNFVAVTTGIWHRWYLRAGSQFAANYIFEKGKFRPKYRRCSEKQILSTVFVNNVKMESTVCDCAVNCQKAPIK
jgi:hypothetical protein